MIKSDFITMKNSALQLLGIMLIVAIFISLGSGTLVAGVAATTAMLSFMYIFSIVAYDEMNGWERFRLTLPISRRQVIAGRYASILIATVGSIVFGVLFSMAGYLVASSLPQIPLAASLVEGVNPIVETSHVLIVAAVLLVAATFSMPLFMRFGMTKATRIVPLVFVLIMIGGLYLIGDFDDMVVQALPVLQTLFVPTPEEALMSLGLSALVFACLLVPYAISAGIAVKLYEKRQF